MNTQPSCHVIKDPVHGTMQFSALENQWLKPFIDSPLIQRLRHIKQLGMGDLLFPGAVHTRFNHSLGCCYIASQIAQQLGLAEEERQLVVIACLLHDIGHGPFSHAFEDIFYQKSIRHEAWTPLFLHDYQQGAFFQHYNKGNPRSHLTDEKFMFIQAMIMHQSPHKRLLADIVSSQLDADRLDYLLRDSHFCGVAYGQFDLRWMLHSMTIIDTGQDERLGLTHKGIGVVEHYLMARRLMTRNIYHHQKKLALEYLLVGFLQTLSASIDDFSPYQSLQSTRLGQFLSAVHRYNEALQQGAAHEPTRQAFLHTHYATYRALADHDIITLIAALSAIDTDHPATHIAKRLALRQLPKIVRLDHADLEEVKQRLAEFKAQWRKDFADWQLALVKTPHQAYTVEGDPIFISDEHGNIKPLNEMSFMIDAIGDKYEHTAFLSIDKAIFSDPRITTLLTSIQP